MMQGRSNPASTDQGSPKTPDIRWVRQEREAAFGLLTGADVFSLPRQGSVSRQFAAGRYREVTARISATSKDLETLIRHREDVRAGGHGIPAAIGWTLAAVVVVFLGFLLGDLAGAAGAAILEDLNE
ncbi:hypothetical protein [Corynebacterium halotolerans]|uniref:hypothetical protein n=1 Tax=Corynebacterium halotolerans TaxID=225326 RepID=UPI003CE6A0A2